MKRIAVVGLGKMGLLHASLLNTLTDVSLVAFCEKSRLIRRFARNIFPDISIVDNVVELGWLDIDAAFVATPPSAHADIIETLLTEGVCYDVFVEKPLANNLEESKALCELPDGLGIDSVNMVGYNRRFGVTFKKAREIIDAGTLGELVSFEGYAFSSDFLATGGRRRNGGMGNVLEDLASHTIDLVLWYLGGVSVEEVISSQVKSGVIDSAAFTVSTAGGLRGQIKTSWAEPGYRLPEIGFVLEGDKGLTLTASDDKVELRSRNGECRVWHKHDLNDVANFMLGGTDYLREDEAFTDAITRRKKIEPSFATALQVDEIIEQVKIRIANNRESGG